MAHSTATKSIATFTPAATSHGARDSFGAATEFASVANNPGECRMVNSAELMISDATAVTTLWELHLYEVTPPSAIADDAVHDVPSGDRSVYLGYVAIPQTTDTGATQYAHVNLIGQQLKLRSTSVFAYLVAVSAITATATAHKVTLHTTLAE